LRDRSLTKSTNAAVSVKDVLRIATASLVTAVVVAGITSFSATAVEQGSVPPVVHGSAAQRGLLRQVLRAMGPTQIRSVAIQRTSDNQVRLVMQPSRRDPSRVSTSVRLGWEANVVAYSFLKRSRARGLPPVVGYSVAGETHTFRSLVPRALPAFEQQRIVRPVRRAVARSGAARIAEFDLLRPSGPSLAVVLVATRPAPFIQQRLAPVIAALNRVVPRVDGFYVAVTDARRSVVFAYSRIDLRGTSSTTLWVRPDLLGCAENLPVENEVAPDGAPRCPAV
jgi:hypothetical protein